VSELRRAERVRSRSWRPGRLAAFHVQPSARRAAGPRRPRQLLAPTCINWLRQEPYVRAWSQAYRSDGWSSSGSTRPGSRSSTRRGGGGRLGHPRTPETHLAYWRRAFASPDGAAFDERRAYVLPERLPFNHWALAGEWTIGSENVVLDQAGGSIACRFHALDTHLVLSRAAREPIPFRVLHDGEAPCGSHGVDVDDDGNGLLQDGPHIPARAGARSGPPADVGIAFLVPGAEAYTFMRVHRPLCQAAEQSGESTSAAISSQLGRTSLAVGSHAS